MTEIFTNIPEDVKQQSRRIVGLAFRLPDPFSAINMIHEYLLTCDNEEEREYVDFMFNLKLEEINESLSH